jgi:hypothetical protein
MQQIKSIFIIFTLFVIACNNEPQPARTLPENTSKITDTMPKSIIHHIYNIDSFLLKPFDLYKFKRKTSSNSSGCSELPDYYFKPKHKGVYWAFFIFQGALNEHLYNGQNPDFIISSESGFEIITYKPHGKYAYEYADPNEELISITARYNHTALPELALNGLDSIEIKQLLGKPLKKVKKCWVYAYKDRFLGLRFREKEVDYLKYVHLNEPYTPKNDSLLLVFP